MPPPQHPATSMLFEVTTEVAIPALEAVLGGWAVEEIVLSVGLLDAPGRPSLAPRDAAAKQVVAVRLRVSVEGEEYSDLIFDEASAVHVDSAEYRARLVGNLEDFVAESRFGWGTRPSL